MDDLTSPLNLLKTSQWLNQLPTKAAHELIKLGKVRRLQKNQQVQAKGDTTSTLFCVLIGEVRVSASTYNGGEIILTRMLPGQWFGEIALLDGGPRTHDVFTMCDTQLIALPGKQVMELCQREPQVYQALVKLLCEHCRKAFGAMDELLAYTPEQRLAMRLLQRLSETNNSQIKINQQEMGALVGISRQSTNKILKTWQEKGWIERIYGGISIVNDNALKQL